MPDIKSTRDIIANKIVVVLPPVTGIGNGVAEDDGFGVAWAIGDGLFVGETVGPLVGAGVGDFVGVGLGVLLAMLV